jgi:hypothetical protein
MMLRVMRPRETALARSQETLWEFLRCFAPENPGKLGYNVFDSVRMPGRVDPQVFRAAVGDVVRRQEALQIVFGDLGPDPSLLFEPDLFEPNAETSITFADLSQDPPRRARLRLANLLAFEERRAFDLTSGPLWRVALIRLTETSNVIAVSMFHMIADGWSTGVFLADVVAAYRARSGDGPPLVPLSLSYDDAVSGGDVDEAARRRRAEFWKRRLTPLADTPDEWAFRPAEVGQETDVCVNTALRLGLPPDSVRHLQAFARRHQVTPFVLYLAAYRILLGIRTGRERLVIGTTTAGRDAPGAESLVGQFTNNIYIETTLTPATTLTETVRAVRSAVFSAMRHTASFKEIARAVNPGFEAMRPWPFLLLYHSWFQSAAPSADTVLNSGSAPDPRSGISEIRTSARRRPDPDLVGDRVMLWAKKGEPGLTVGHDRRSAEMNFNPTFYDRDSIAETLRGYTSVLAALLQDPERRLSEVRLA